MLGWSRWWDSNPHGVSHPIPNRARVPISPHRDDESARSTYYLARLDVGYKGAGQVLARFPGPAPFSCHGLVASHAPRISRRRLPPGEAYAKTRHASTFGVYDLGMDAVTWTQTQVRQLESRIAHVADTIRGLEQQQRELSEQAAHLRAWLALYPGGGAGEGADVGQKASVPESGHAANRSQNPRGSVGDGAAEVLRELGRPASTREITSELTVRGMVKGKDDKTDYATVYSAMLRRPQQFRKAGGGLWALIDQLPPDVPDFPTESSANGRQQPSEPLLIAPQASSRQP